MKNEILGNLELLRKIAKNKTQLTILENLYNSMIGIRLSKSSEINQGLKLCESYPEYFEIKMSAPDRYDFDYKDYKGRLL